jgi:uncharacterized membrane protein
MDKEVKGKVAEWVGGGLTVSEIHQRLEEECGLHLTRVDVHMLVGDLEDVSAQTASQTVSNPNTERSKQRAAVDYLEQRLRQSNFERRIGARIPVLFRWLLFIPAGLATGVFAFAMILIAWILIAPISGDEDAMGFGGMSAGFFGGFASVWVGMIVAPRGARMVAAIMGGACVVLTAVVLFLVWRMHDFESRLSALIGAGIYSASAVIAAIVFGRSHDTAQRQKRKPGA